MFPQITVSGAPYDRGHTYGVQAAGRIRHSIASYARLFAYRRGLRWADVEAQARAYAAPIGAFAPDLLEEIEGIAAGAQLPVETILALNARTELLAGAGPGVRHPAADAAFAANRTRGVPEHTECTAIAVQPAASATGRPILAQNWDWGGDQRAACVLLRVESPGRPALVTLTEAGMVAKIGMNALGLGVCLNILRSMHDGQAPGVPVHVLLRAMLTAGSVAEALSLAIAAPAAASSNLLVADATGDAASIERTPAGYGVLHPHAGVLIHTNHCVAAETCPVASPLDPTSSSIPRYDRAHALLLPQAGRIDRAAVMAMLRDEHGGAMAICRSPDLALPPTDRTETVASIVMELADGALWVAPDLPSRVEYTRLSL